MSVWLMLSGATYLSFLTQIVLPLLLLVEGRWTGGASIPGI